MRTAGSASLYRQIEAGEVDILAVPSSGEAGEDGTFLYLKHGANGVHREMTVDRAGRHTVRDAVAVLAPGEKRPRHAMVQGPPPVVRVERDMGDYVAVAEVCADCDSGILAEPLVEKGVCGTCGRERH